MRFLFSLLIVPIAASFFPYVANLFFDSPQSHGILSADVFFLVLLLILPQGKILLKNPLVVVAGLYAVISNTIEAYAATIVYILMILATTAIPRNRKFVCPLFTLFALFFAIADWGNFFYSTFVLTLPDVWGLAKFYWWGVFLFIAIPLFQIALEFFLAHTILLGKNRVQLSHLAVFFIIAVSLILNFGINKLQQRQPVMDFTVQKWLWELCTPGIIGQNTFLQEDIKSAFSIWQHNNTVVKDFDHPTLMVLVESYGVNKRIEYTDSLLAPFNNSNVYFAGLYSRNAGHTQGAEWEDFDVPGGKILNESPLPRKFRDNGLQTWFLHGYKSDFYNRSSNYAKFGFDSLLFRAELSSRGLKKCCYGFAGVCDSAIVDFIDSLLADSVPKFIYWTTLDAHPPYETAKGIAESPTCLALSLTNINCTYFTLQQSTLKKIASLAAAHPNYRFVIRGDHRPMGSLEQSDFVQSFYFRWVPLIILN